MYTLFVVSTYIGIDRNGKIYLYTPPGIITNHPVLVPTALNSVIILFYSCEQSS